MTEVALTVTAVPARALLSIAEMELQTIPPSSAMMEISTTMTDVIPTARFLLAETAYLIAASSAMMEMASAVTAAIQIARRPDVGTGLRPAPSSVTMEISTTMTDVTIIAPFQLAETA
jgi:hypothetical protein